MTFVLALKHCMRERDEGEGRCHRNGATILKVNHIVTDIHERKEKQTSGKQIKLFGGGNTKSTESQG